MSAAGGAQAPVPLTALLPAAGPLSPADGEAALVALYDEGPLSGHTPGMRVQANMVLSLDGAVVGPDGRSGTISSPADKRVFSVLRSLADCVVVGAGTARAERYTRLSPKPAHREQRAARGQAPVPALVLVTASGDIDTERLDAAGSSPVIVLTSADDPQILARLRAWAGSEAVARLRPGFAPAEALAELRRRGFVRVLTEGGPSLLGAWIRAGAVDELCATIAPLLAGAAADGHAPAGLLGAAHLRAPVGAVPASVLTGEGALICRYRVDAPPEAPEG
ncbi:dihydrofolate reductase family protein [Brevibacterium sp. BRM-1]|uniref:dihydrofolate reductase family protein n=1 Tax=Brevibacterium sp. BRM-1 TaxID=2999062 RepID=UPI00228329D1|nr:dihydrofolate reductase family protein [Brevibacterium sp. BRM-1]WAL41033.1 dihydrofolate reductase family protein [Brevibacterium sp. BRM-1]